MISTQRQNPTEVSGKSNSVVTAKDLGEIKGFTYSNANNTAKEVVLVGSSGLVQTIDLQTGHRESVGQVLGPVYASDIFPGGTVGAIDVPGLLVTANERGASLYKFPSLDFICDLPSSISRFTTITFDISRQNILLGGGDGLIYRWKLYNPSGDFEPNRKKSLERYFGHSSYLTNIIASRTSKNIFFSIDEAGVLSGYRTYDSDRFGGEYDESLFDDRAYADQATRKNFQLKSKSQITASAISSDGQLLALGGQDGGLEVVSTQGFVRRALVAEAHRGEVLSATFLSGNLIASVGRDGRVALWSFEEQPHPGIASQATFTLHEVKQAFVPGGYRILAVGKLELAVATRDDKVLALRFTL